MDSQLQFCFVHVVNYCLLFLVSFLGRNPMSCDGVCGNVCLFQVFVEYSSNLMNQNAGVVDDWCMN